MSHILIIGDSIIQDLEPFLQQIKIFHTVESFPGETSLSNSQ